MKYGPFDMVIYNTEVTRLRAMLARRVRGVPTRARVYLGPYPPTGPLYWMLGSN